jgi:hypothetical protein
VILYSRGKISWNAFDGNPTLPLNNINTIFATRVALDQAFENTPGPNVLINDDLTGDLRNEPVEAPRDLPIALMSNPHWGSIIL